MSFLASHSKRLSSLLIPTLVLAIVVHEVLNTTIYTERELREMREDAVSMASLGQFETALEKLRALSEVAPQDAAIWGDYLVVLTRANQAETAFALYRANPQRSMPDYAWAELFTAALARNELQLARELAQSEINQSANAEAVRAARELALAAAMPVLAESLPDAADTILADVAESPTATPEPAAASQQTANTQAPVPTAAAAVAEDDDAEPAPAVVNAPQVSPPSLPAPQPAPELVTAVPAATTDIDALAEQARLAVRAAELAPAAQRNAEAEHALAMLDRYATALADGSGSDLDMRNAKLDRIRALTLAGRHDEAKTLFDAMGDPRELPVFGLLNGADLHIRMEQPDAAAVLLDIALDQEPANRSVLLTLFYLELNRENYGQADATISVLKTSAATTAEQREVRMLEAQLAAYSNRLQKAQRELEALAAEDPSSVEVRQRLAQLYRWRGWPRRALEEYRKAENLAEEPGSAQLGAVSALVDMHSYMEAQSTLAAISQSAPQHPELASARAEQQQRRRREYRAQVSAGNSSDSPVTGAGNISFEQRLTSAPIAEHVRLFARQRYDWADFREGSAILNRVGAGVDFRSRQFDAMLEINERNGGGNTGVNLSGEWHFDDRFSAFADFASDNSAAPLRGLNSGLRGNSRGFGVLYRAHESSQTLLRYSLADLNDGNEREAFTLRQQNTWFLQDRRRLRLTAEAYYGRSSLDAEPVYYNPTGEKAATVTLEYTTPLPAHLAEQWFQRIAVGAGAYQQHGFGGSAIWDLEYEQIVQLGAAFEINYGLLYRSRVYAGDREAYAALFGGLVWRF